MVLSHRAKRIWWIERRALRVREPWLNGTGRGMVFGALGTSSLFLIAGMITVILLLT